MMMALAGMMIVIKGDPDCCGHAKYYRAHAGCDCAGYVDDCDAAAWDENVCYVTQCFVCLLIRCFIVQETKNGFYPCLIRYIFTHDSGF